MAGKSNVWSMRLVALTVLLLSPAALAATKTYSGPSGGAWNTATNWSPVNVPVAGDAVRLLNSTAADLQVLFNNSSSYNIGSWLASLTIDASAAGNVTLLHPDAGAGADFRMAALDQFVGYDGHGAYTQNGGINLADSLYIAYNPNSAGSYTLNGGQLSVKALIVADDSNAQGAFIQNGGVVSAEFGMSLGNFTSASNGRYEMHGGTLTTGTLTVGHRGAGTFIQTGGAVTSTRGMEIADVSDFGLYDQQAGSLVAFYLPTTARSAVSDHLKLKPF